MDFTKITEECRALDQAVGMYKSMPGPALHLLRTSSAEVLNFYDVSGWTTLNYVLWMLKGHHAEIEMLQTLLGPEVVKEDHSGLRIDQFVFARSNYPMVAAACGVFGILHPSVATNLNSTKWTPMELLQFHRASCVATPALISNLDLATNLLQTATDRIQTYPKRLLNVLIDACTDLLPVQTLYPIIAAYLCH
jgi:hypothetical protein